MATCFWVRHFLHLKAFHGLHPLAVTGNNLVFLSNLIRDHKFSGCCLPVCLLPVAGSAI